MIHQFDCITTDLYGCPRIVLFGMHLDDRVDLVGIFADRDFAERGRHVRGILVGCCRCEWFFKGYRTQIAVALPRQVCSSDIYIAIWIGYSRWRLSRATSR